MTIAEIHIGRGCVELLSDAEAPDAELRIRHVVHRGQTVRGRDSASRAVVGTPVGRDAILAVERRITRAEPVLRDTTLDKPVGGIFLVGRALTPVSAGRANRLTRE